MPMVRSHYVDPRSIHPGMKPINVLDAIMSAMHENDGSYIPTTAIDAFYSTDISDIDKFRKYSEAILLDESRYIGKEIARSYLSTEIRLFILLELEHTYVRTYPLLQRSFQNILDNVYDPRDPAIVFNSVIALNAPFMDAYLLSRMFKTFKSPGGNGKSPLFTEEPMSMIVYAGDNHAERVRRFLDIQNFNTTEYAQLHMSGGKLYDRCLDLSSISQPLFAAYAV